MGSLIIRLIWATTYYDTPERVTEARDLLQKSGLLQKLETVSAVPAPRECLESFHSPEYIAKLEKLSTASGGEVGELCQIGAHGLDVIRHAVGGDMAALDQIMAGKIDNAFCLQRPPSAHAERDRGFGFCVGNDFNILINYAREKYGLKRIMIIDFDEHYKKGIEDAWYATDEVLCAEIHHTGTLPENSAADRNADYIGADKGKGYNVVIPLPAGSGDAAYIRAFQEIIMPVAQQYKPELVVLIAGYASNIFDPLGRMQLTATGYGQLTEIIADLSDKYAQGRLLAILEGAKAIICLSAFLKPSRRLAAKKQRWRIQPGG